MVGLILGYIHNNNTCHLYEYLSASSILIPRHQKIDIKLCQFFHDKLKMKPIKECHYVLRDFVVPFEANLNVEALCKNPNAINWLDKNWSDIHDKIIQIVGLLASQHNIIIIYIKVKLCIP